MPDDIALDERHQIGANNPPPDIKVGEALREELRDNHGALVTRKEELLKMADRFDADYATVENDDVSGVLAGIITQINGHKKIADTTREGVKAPYLEGGRIVDEYFTGGIIGPLEKRMAELNEKQTAFQRAKAARIKREAEEAARKAREEEDARRREAEKAERERQRAEREARKAQDDAAAAADAQRRADEAAARAEEAREAEERARLQRQEQSKVASSSAADRSRVRGDYAMSSLRTTWKFAVIDITKVPPEFLLVNQPLVNAAIRGKNGRRDISGLRIYAEEDAVNR